MNGKGFKRGLATLALAVGFSTAPLSPLPVGAGIALAAPSESLQVWRAQIRLATADVEDAGTDDSVKVKLSRGNTTWLDYGRDDFERNDTFTYDLGLTSIDALGLEYPLDTLAGISDLSLSKTGSDGWCIRSFDLLINGRAIYSRTFGNTAGTCRWLDNEGGATLSYTVPSAALRAHPLWQNFTQPFPPLVIPRGETESRVEGMTGDTIHGGALDWGHISGRAVEAWRLNAQALHVDLDLEYEVNNWFNPEVDLDFDLRVSCSDGVISVTSENITVVTDNDWYAEVLSLGIVEFFEDDISRGIKDAFKPVTSTTQAPFCPQIYVNASGDIEFSPPAPPVITRSLTVSKLGLGSVTSNPAGISCGFDCSQNYPDGTLVTLTARGGSNPTRTIVYVFDHWEGACTGTSPSCALRMTTNRSARAVFVPLDLDLDLP